MPTRSVNGAGGWQPILSGAARQRALQTVDVMAESIAPLTPGQRDPSLAGGQAGLAVLYAWLAEARRSAQAGDVACACLDRAIDAVATEAMPSSFWGGFVGVAWAAELVDRRLGREGEDRNAAIDDVLVRLVSRPAGRPVPHDLVTGVTGVGVYALERYPRRAAVECLQHVVERLEQSAQRDPQGTYWWTSPAGIREPREREKYPFGRADLGMAHGVAGAIGLLGAICAAGAELSTARPLLEGAVSWLLSQALPAEWGSTFPIWVAPRFHPRPARCAWCYGDPGVSAALLCAARGAEHPDWEKQAVALACRAAERPTKETGVVDASVCHGAAGLAHVYNRLYQATQEPTLGRAAVYWLERTLEFCRAAQNGGDSWISGTPNPRQGPWTGLDLVDGAAGIALVLLAAATPVEPTWDRMFLLSARHATEAHHG